MMHAMRPVLLLCVVLTCAGESAIAASPVARGPVEVVPAVLQSMAQAATTGRDLAAGFGVMRVSNHPMSPDQVVALVQRATGGRVLDLRQRGDAWRVKVLMRDGEVRTVWVDARTGRLQ